MKNFKYFVFFICSFFLLSNTLFALRVNGKVVDDFEQDAKELHTTLHLETKGHLKEGVEPNINVEWKKQRRKSVLDKSSKASKGASAVSDATSPPPPQSRLRRSTSARKAPEDKIELTRSSPKGSPKAGKKAVTGVSNPLHRDTNLGKRLQKQTLIQSLETPSTSESSLPVLDFGAGDGTLDTASTSESSHFPLNFGAGDSTLRRISSKLKSSAPTDSHPPFCIISSGPIHPQKFTDLTPEKPIQLHFPALCTLQVYPANPQCPLSLTSGSFELKSLLLSLTFENCGKIKILPPQSIEI